MEYGLIGEKLGHSYSRVIHEILGAYSYQLCPLSPGELASFVTARKYKGLNVTIPYKRQALSLCDRLDPIAERIGAVNTLYFKGKELWGTNTDYDGFLFMLRREGISLAGQKVLILGSGGASSMVLTAAADRGAREVHVASRKGPLTYDRLPEDVQAIVNTTPVGTYPQVESRPLDLAEFPACNAVVDLIYNPSRTRLMLQAQKLGIRYAGGLSMLVAQATKAAEYFTGRDDFSRRNEEIIQALSEKMTNLVLIGMPGCGKSTLGKKAADRLQMDFFDTDLEIARRTGRRPKDIIQEEGEAVFRQIEGEVVAELAKEHGRVIATGGGVVLSEENMAALKQNGRIIYIRRPLHCLARSGRPLSANMEALKKMSQVRTPLYEQYADEVVENTGTLDDGIELLIHRFFSSHSSRVME
ncbi:MAG: shikimate kinase [Anaerovoracaceae bacterium]|jgi:shikimate dehydrogenase